jgi:GT2 family glycosyltransferase
LRPDAGSSPEDYRAWLAGQADTSSRPARRWRWRVARGPQITFLLAADAPAGPALRSSLASLAAQDSDRWRAVVAMPPTARARRGIGLGSGRVGVVTCPIETGVQGALAVALVHAVTSYVAVLGPGDRLAPSAVSAFTTVIDDRAADVVYGDEDHEGADGELQPRFKPDWSPDLLLGCPYLGRPVVVRRRVVVAAGGLGQGTAPGWEHDLMLRTTEMATLVVHVPEVLCHRAAATPNRDAAADGARQPSPTALALGRRGERAVVEPGPLPGTHRVRRAPPRSARVGAIIPFRDEPQLLRACVDSLQATLDDVRLEVILVDNGSSEPETASLLDLLDERPEITVLRDPRPFNWAAINNAAARRCDHDVLVFLNNDIEAARHGWLDVLVAQAWRPEVGAVGARLVYPDRRVQHVGIVVGLGGAAGHVLAGLDAAAPGYLGMAVLARECSAVTGACLATRRSVFEELGGFDEQLGLDLNDVDYCLRAQAGGWRVLVDPGAELVHHESPSRGTSGSVADITRFIDRWEDLILAGDPFLSANLTRLDSSCALRDPGEGSWWREWRKSLGM